ncbi:hypothetical protein [Polaromonas sp. CG9_12]|nr:hypothetical protein [Polaromonas sp. CG9_12]
MTALTLPSKPPPHRSQYFQVICALIAGIALGFFHPSLGDGFI